MVVKKGERVFSKYYVLYYCKNELSYPRLGLILSKRNLRLAVQRGLMKRLAREVFRKKQHELQAVDIVLIAQKSANGVNKKELNKCLEKLLVRLVKFSNGTSSDL